MRGRGVDSQQTAHFLIQCIFCMYAEDESILHEGATDDPQIFTAILKSARNDPEKARQRVANLFKTMRKGGSFGYDDIAWFNGGLFEVIDIPALTGEELEILRHAAEQLDWRAIDPTIFGTLFERGLDPDARAPLGAHYTDVETIHKLIRPLIVEPLAAEWAAILPQLEAAKDKGITETTPFAEKLRGLKGLTVGVTQAGALTAHLAAFVIRKAGYLPQQDVKIIPIGAGPTWLAALENRKVDVALTATPVPETAVSRGFALMLIDNAKGEDPSIPEFLMENLITRPEVIEKNPDLVRRMVRALHKANKWALAGTPEQVAEALKPTLGKNAPPEVFLAGVKSTLPALSPDGRTSERSVQITQDILEQAGILKKRIPYAEVVNNDFLPR